MPLKFKDLLNSSIFHLILIAIAGTLVYSNSFEVPFQYDDNFVIVNNSIIKDLGFFAEPSTTEGLRGDPRYDTFYSRYLSYLSFAVNYRLHGLDTFGYHLFNLMVHIISAILIYYLMLLSFRTPHLTRSRLRSYSKQIAIVTALLFLAHPIQTQAVTYIVKRVASMCTMFYLLSLACYIKWRIANDTGKKKTIFYILSIISAVLAMKTKEIAFTLPAAIAVYELFFFKGSMKRRLIYLLPLILTMLIIPASRMGIDSPLGQSLAEATRDNTAMSRHDYFITEISVLVTYLRLIFLPARQSLDYDYQTYTSMLSPHILFSSALLLFLAAAAIYLYHRCREEIPETRIISFGILWFFITLSVESSFIPIPHVIFEHRMYIASFGIFAAISTSLFILLERLNRRWPYADRLAVIFITAVLLTLSSAAYARNNVWKDDLTLWSDVVAKGPGNPRAQYNLAFAYQNRAMMEEAEIHYQKAADAAPYSFADPFYNLGIIHASQGRDREAIGDYKRAIMIKPDHYKAHTNLGLVYKKKGMLDKAIEHFNAAIGLKPDDAEPYYNLGNVYLSKGMASKAIENYRYAIRLRPGLAEAYINMGNAYRSQGETELAKQQYRAALRLRPGWELPLDILKQISE